MVFLSCPFISRKLHKKLLNRISFILIFLCVCILACNEDNKDLTRPDADECPAGQWNQDTGGAYAYTHDCNPYHSTHFSIYSDGSSTDSKRQLAELAEEVFNELCAEFNIQNIEAELYIFPEYTYYIYAQKYIEDIKAMGYRNGFFVAAFDCVTIPNPYSRNPAFYKYIVKHEMTHVFQFSLTDCPSNAACPEWLSVWFREGQAIYTGDYPGIIIDNINEFEIWIADPTHINPIEIYRWVNFPDPDRAGEYYPMFGLAYQFLVDSAYGLGASIADMREMFDLMSEGDGFYDAFEAVMGMSVSWYKDQFYSLIANYLNQRNILAKPDESPILFVH